MRSHFPHLLCATASAFAAIAAPAVHAADFPSHAITIVVPYSAGGGADVIARSISKVMSEGLKQPVVVDNKPGAAGQIAAAGVARAAPDGYTVLLSTDNMYSINPVLFGKSAKDALAGLAPVSNMVGAPVVVVVSTEGKAHAKTLAELIAYAKAQGTPLTYASPGVGTPHQLIAESIARAAGIQLTHVPYKGTTAALTDLMGGQVDMLFGMPASVQPMATAGKVRILAVTTSEPFPLLPSTPTVSQTLKGVAISSVDMGLMVPAGTPQPVVQRLNEEARKAIANPEVRATMKANGMIAMDGSPADYSKRMALARQEREHIIELTGIKAE
jgi:tripartite-type tricarboxylate transporter receptor subunit TctC